MKDALLTPEEVEARYAAFKVECERIRHNINVIEERLDELDNVTATKPRKGFAWHLFKGVTV